MSNPNPSPETRFKPGESGNLSGRPKGGLKCYDREKFAKMTDEEKEEWLKGVSKELRYKMAEGNPQTDITSGGDKINPIPIIEIKKDTQLEYKKGTIFQTKDSKKVERG